MVREVLLVIRPEDYDIYNTLLGNGENLGIQIHYIFQDEALGIADALYKCKAFVDDNVLVLLGDNFSIQVMWWKCLINLYKIRCIVMRCLKRIYMSNNNSSYNNYLMKIMDEG